MKYILALFTFCTFSSLAQAFGEECRLFDVNIKNASGADCVLKKHYIIQGQLSENSQIPEVIFRDDIVHLQLKVSNTSTSLSPFAALLHYECGDGNDLAFFTTTSGDVTALDLNASNNAVLESNNMSADFNFKRCNNIFGRINAVTWVIKTN